jgi:cytochrome c peroxidase
MPESLGNLVSMSRFVPCCGTWLLAALAAWLPPTALSEPAPTASRAQIEAILSHGPWPPPVVRDPGNRVSGNPLAIELGRQLFFDPRMSPIGYIACVSCHQPDRAFADLKSRGHGLADLDRNTIALANLRQQKFYGWGGSSDSVWMASLRPILDEREFNGSPASVAKLFRRDEELAQCYQRVFGVSPAGDDERTLVNVAKALAAYEETLVTGRTPFDDYRDALARGDVAAASYPVAAQRGLLLFIGRGQCSSCHSGPMFSDGDFHDTGAPPPVAPTQRDTGRAEGAQALLSSRFNLMGVYNDDSTRANAAATQFAHDDGRRIGEFRTPGLRNVAVTGPYMHNGRLETLTAVVTQHAKATRHSRALSKAEVTDLVAFLATLTDADGERRPGRAGKLSCP